MGNPSDSKHLPLHKLQLDPLIIPNCIHAILYSCAILALLYHRFVRLLNSPTRLIFFILLGMSVSDLILGVMWVLAQAFRWRPVRRQEFPENLPSVISESEFPKLDVFICTADPYKEPPISVVNTALSVLALDYPAEKLSVYVSDDGGSELTLFAFMEAAKFARHWLPFCKKKKIEDRCPEAYLGSNAHLPPSGLKVMYERMKTKVGRAMDKGGLEDGINVGEEEAFELWRLKGFTRRDHPAVIQPLLQNDRDTDTEGKGLPNLVYVSREKSRSHHHHFKAGALNALLRVSGKMTDAPLILTIDCDMYCNDPQAALRVLCYLVDEEMQDVAYVQFPQRYRGLNRNDIYASEYKRLLQINPMGFDGLQGPNFVGTGCFFRRRALYGPPSSSLEHDFTASKRSFAEDSHHLASCSYEDGTSWGNQVVGFRYGCLVEDFFTGYRLVCEGWRSLFCNPERAAFLGDVPINLKDALSQNKRWFMGLLDVVFSKYSPLIYGFKKLSLPMGMCYLHHSHWPFYAIPITIYGLLPQLSLLAQLPPIFPKASDPWFYLHAYLFLGAYGQDLIDFLREKGTIQRRWSDQRMWMIRGASSLLSGLVQFSFKLLGISGLGFSLTTKVMDEEQHKRYEQGVFEFGAASPLFVPIGTIAIINLVSFSVGLVRALLMKNVDQVFAQLLISGFVAVNYLPVYEALILRSDQGRMPTLITMLSLLTASILYFCCSPFSHFYL